MTTPFNGETNVTSGICRMYAIKICAYIVDDVKQFVYIHKSKHFTHLGWILYIARCSVDQYYSDCIFQFQ